jgi:hypothetical protein
MPAIKRLAKWPRRRPDPPGVTLPRTQRPKTPNAQKHPTPKHPTPIQRPGTSLCQSRRRREGCLGTTFRDASQSIRPADLVVAALEYPTQHPTPPGRPCRAPNAKGRPTPWPPPNAPKRTPTDRYAYARGASGGPTEAPRRVSRPKTSSSPPVEASSALPTNRVTKHKQKVSLRGDPAVPPEEQKSEPATPACPVQACHPHKPPPQTSLLAPG